MDEATLSRKVTKMRSLIAVGILMTAVVTTSAATLELTQQFPDINVNVQSIDYDHTNGIMTVTGFPQQYADPNGTSFSAAWNYQTVLTANIDSSGNLTPAGSTLSITGFIIGTTNNGLLLEGDLTAFDFNTNGGSYEFTGNVTGGLLAGDYGPELEFGIFLTPSAEFLFASDFSDTGSIQMDVFKIPEPATLALGAMGLMCLARRRG